MPQYIHRLGEWPLTITQEKHMTTKKSSVSRKKVTPKKVTLEQVMMATDKARPKQAIDLKPKAIKFDEVALANITAGTEQHIQGSTMADLGVSMIAMGFDKAFYTDHDCKWTEMVMKEGQKKHEGDPVAQKVIETYKQWEAAYTANILRDPTKTEANAKSAVSTQWGRIKKASEIAPKPKDPTEQDFVKNMVKAVRALVKADATVREAYPKLFTGEDHKTMIAVASAWLVKYDV